MLHKHFSLLFGYIAGFCSPRLYPKNALTPKVVGLDQLLHFTTKSHVIQIQIFITAQVNNCNLQNEDCTLTLFYMAHGYDHHPLQIFDYYINWNEISRP